MHVLLEILQISKIQKLFTWTKTNKGIKLYHSIHHSKNTATKIIPEPARKKEGNKMSTAACRHWSCNFHSLKKKCRRRFVDLNTFSFVSEKSKQEIKIRNKGKTKKVFYTLLIDVIKSYKIFKLG